METQSFHITDQHRHSCRKILTLLDMSQGFEVLFLECNSPMLQRDLEHYLEEQGKAFHWLKIHLEQEIDNLNDELLTRQLPIDEHSVLSIRGLDSSIRDEHTAADIVARLNLARDFLPKHFPCPLLLWLPHYALQQFVRFAPDLWSWRAGLFYFEPLPQTEEAARITPIRQRPDTEITQYSKAFRESEIEFLTSQIAGFDPQTASERELKQQIINLLGEQYRKLHRFPKALKALQEVEQLCGQIEDQTKIAECYNEIGMVYHKKAELQKALRYFEQALEIDRAAFGDQHPDVATDLNNLGTAWNELGEHHKAIEYYDQALDIDCAAFGEQHPNIARDLNNLGEAWRELGESRKAVAYHEQALDIDRAAFGEQHPDVATDLNNLGIAWNNLGESRKAIEYNEQALTIDHAAFGEQHPNVARDLNNLGLAWNDLGESRKAIEYNEQALAINRAAFGEQHPDVARDLNNLGITLAQLGELQQAQECYQQALVIFTQFYGSEHHSTRTVQENLELLLQKLDASSSFDSEKPEMQEKGLKG